VKSVVCDERAASIHALELLEARLLRLSSWMIHNANHSP
jgi:hypothetical protein